MPACITNHIAYPSVPKPFREPAGLSKGDRQLLAALRRDVIVTAEQIRALMGYPNSGNSYAKERVRQLRSKGVAIANVRGYGWRLL